MAVPPSYPVDTEEARKDPPPRSRLKAQSEFLVDAGCSYPRRDASAMDGSPMVRWPLPGLWKLRAFGIFAGIRHPKS